MRHGAWGFRGPYRRFLWRSYRPFRWWRPYPWYPLWWRPLFWLPWTLMVGGFVFLLYDTFAYKLHGDDARRIERETGKPTRSMTQGELVDAMRELGIQKLEFTPEDRDAIARSKSEGVRYCIHCGSLLSYEASYCSACGKKTDF